MQIAGYIKVGQKDHIDELRHKGLIYCNTVKYFRTLEDGKNSFRADKFDGSSANINLTSLKIFNPDGSEIPLNFRKGRMNLYDEKVLADHLYCLFTIKSEYADKGPFIDSKLNGLGEQALLITDTVELKKRIEVKLTELGVEYQFGFVDYYDTNIDHTNLTVFDKPDEFAFQNELRVYIKGQDGETFRFEIGSLEEISVLVDATNLDKLTMEIVDQNNEP